MTAHTNVFAADVSGRRIQSADDDRKTREKKKWEAEKRGATCRLRDKGEQEMVMDWSGPCTRKAP